MSSSTEGASQSSQQLDFYQAMADFKLMFPDMDEEIIEAVLRANGGVVDGTIDQLLTMNTDFAADQSANTMACSISRQPPVGAKLKRIVELSGRGRLTISGTSSGSYESDDFGSSFCRHGTSKSSIKSSLGSECGLEYSGKNESCEMSSNSTNLSENLILLDSTTDESRVFSSATDICDSALLSFGRTPSQQSWDDDSFFPAAPAPPIPPRSPLLVAPPLPPKMSLLGSVSGCGISESLVPQEGRKMVKQWDPPMLGKLPDDFLRLEIGPSPQRILKTSPTSTQRGTFLTHSTHDATRSRASREETSPLSSNRVRGVRPNSETGQSRNHSGAGHLQSHRSSHDGIMSMTHSCDCQRHSSGGHERLASSKRRLEIDANTWQMLEDERLALVLQSEEFLAELRQNEDFMRSLEHERQLRNSGSDAQSVLPMLEKSNHPEDSAEFRTLLKHIGDTSKKKKVPTATLR